MRELPDAEAASTSDAAGCRVEPVARATDTSFSVHMERGVIHATGGDCIALDETTTYDFVTQTVTYSGCYLESGGKGMRIDRVDPLDEQQLAAIRSEIGKLSTVCSDRFPACGFDVPTTVVIMHDDAGGERRYQDNVNICYFTDTDFHGNFG